MSFETERKKVQKLWEGSQLNQFTIQVARTVNTIKGQQVQQLPPRVIQLNVLNDLGSDWIDDIAVVKFIDNNGKPYADTIAFQWEITATLPEDWIPFARFNFAYDNSGGIDPFVNLQTNLQYFVGMNLTQPNPNLVAVTWYITMSVRAFGSHLPSDFRGKLYFTLLNPNQFS